MATRRMHVIGRYRDVQFTVLWYGDYALAEVHTDESSCTGAWHLLFAVNGDPGASGVQTLVAHEELLRTNIKWIFIDEFHLPSDIDRVAARLRALK
jgi:hypothetical protein